MVRNACTYSSHFRIEFQSMFGDFVQPISQAEDCTTAKKIVVLTTEWLAWLQTSCRDSGYERFALVYESNCIRQPNRHFIFQPQTTDNPQNICEVVTTNALHSCSKELSCSYSVRML